MSAIVNLLIIDDSLVIRAMMTDLLQKAEGINIVGAVGSTADASRMLATRQVDVVTLDIEMPGINGLDYLDTLVRRGVPVVMLSGQTVEGSDMRAKALGRGASACFDKAHAVRDAQELIKLIKDVARHRARLNPVDHAARYGAAARYSGRGGRYFFHVSDEGMHPDPVGVELPDLALAIGHAHAVLENIVRRQLATGIEEARAGVAIVDEAGKHIASISSITRTQLAA
jgi:chemotaxis response regulator CheB